IQNNPGNAQFVDAITGAVIPKDTPITARLVQGVANFTTPSGNPLALDRAGIGYTLRVESINNGTLLPATSNAFVVTAGAPTRLACVTQPTYTDANVIDKRFRDPANTFKLSGTFAKGSTTISLPKTTRLVVDAAVSGPGIEDETTIVKFETPNDQTTLITL